MCILLGERSYDFSYFHNRVERVLIDDHNVPRLRWENRYTNDLCAAQRCFLATRLIWLSQWPYGSKKMKRMSSLFIAKVAKVERERWSPLLCWKLVFVKLQQYVSDREESKEMLDIGRLLPFRKHWLYLLKVELIFGSAKPSKVSKHRLKRVTLVIMRRFCMCTITNCHRRDCWNYNPLSSRRSPVGLVHSNVEIRN